ncbi:MAG TPA: hypothetical protein VF549_01080 [Solirubrobacteraceae bacterium]
MAAVGMVAAVPMTADADSARDRATGGGQVLLDPNNPPTTGALDTVAFTAQRAQGAGDDSTLATGQVQVNRRSGTGDTQVKFHGVVDCLVVFGTKSAGKAYISGHVKNDPETPFELYVVDGGSGAEERGADQILVWYGDETNSNHSDQQVPANMPTGLPEDEFCGIEEDPSSKRQIPVQARGNTQVYDASGAAAARQQSTTKSSALRLSALR